MDKQKKNYYIIFGAAVRSDGSPSGAMERRIKAALTQSDDDEKAKFVVTGGKGNTGYTEAVIMAEILQKNGISKEKIIKEELSRNTFESIINCYTILERNNDAEAIIISTDTYHLIRTRWLFRLLKIKTSPVKIPSGKKVNGSVKWTWYYIREFAAIIKDTSLLILNKPGIMRHSL